MARVRTSPIESFDIGDTGSFITVEGDVKQMLTGTIAHIARHGRMRHLISGEGKTLAIYDIEKPREVAALMIKRYVPQEPGLFDV